MAEGSVAGFRDVGSDFVVVSCHGDTCPVPGLGSDHVLFGGCCPGRSGIWAGRRLTGACWILIQRFSVVTESLKA
jgi:hypothetical protein